MILAATAGADEMQLVLRDGLCRPDDPTARMNLVLDLAVEDGRWGRVWPLALDYGHGLHTGRVLEAVQRPGALRLRLAVAMGEDTWHAGGMGLYTLDLARTGDGRLEGTYAAAFEGHALAGPVDGVVKPPRPIVVPDFTPLAPGEHPRLLVRVGDLPALRAKSRTPFGRAWRDAAARRRDLVSLGLLYQITEDPAYATEAMTVVTGYGERLVSDDPAPDSREYGHRLVRVAHALDLCWDAWPARFRDDLVERLERTIAEHQSRLMIARANPHPCSHTYGPARGAPAIASLVLFGEPGPALPRPAPPGAESVRLVPPSADPAGPGVPVVTLEASTRPDRWLVAGPVPHIVHPDLVDAMTRDGSLRPSTGTKVAFEMLVAGRPTPVEMTFQAPPAAAVSIEGVDLAKLGAGPGASTTLLYTVLEVEAEQTVGLERGARETLVWLGGRLLAGETLYRLAPGRYPLLAAHATGRTTGTVGPCLVGPGSPAMARRQMAYELERAAWRADREIWQATGAEARKVRLADVGRQQVYRHYRLGIGDGGFGAETGDYADVASHYPLIYATYYRRCFGRDASPYPDVTHLVSRRLMQMHFPPGGRPRARRLASAAGFRGDWAAAAYPIVPRAHRPAVLWAWNRVAGASTEAPEKALEGTRDLALAHTFVHYPLGAEPRPPAEVLPPTWHAPTFGYHVFRSGRDEDTLIGQVFAKAAPAWGWSHPNAGTFRIFGFGRPWVAGSDDRAGLRLQEPVVLLPEDETNPDGCGRVTHLAADPDGSGRLTIDYRDVYARPARLYDRTLLRRPERFVASDITGLRALGFDYSGASGAPALLVVVDRIEGGGRREWLWPVPRGWPAKVKVEERAFTITDAGATMRATFAAPAEVRIEAVRETVRASVLGDRRRTFEGTLERVKAHAGPDAPGFFVVVTFTRGPAPAVTVRGTGLEARVRVGGRTVTFDGAKVVLEP